MKQLQIKHTEYIWIGDHLLFSIFDDKWSIAHGDIFFATETFL